jgi:hypothetical protein
MSHWGETKGRKNRAVATNRQQQALALHKAGAGYQAIADRLGYAGPSGAYKAVEPALRKTLQQPADEPRGLELERLDRMQVAIWDKAIAGNLRAVDRVLKIMRRRAQLLGLDAPRQVAVSVGVTVQQMAEKMAARYGLDVAEVLTEAEWILAEMRGEGGQHRPVEARELEIAN